ncbi:hypothetical protein ALO_17056 [Acetonema longum DSM 6540]|uniref:Uncharacterized protein n=1 Tax=Acetonema longum DSM 6540 TaxID=1009370 RepID=F7NMT0_9FIRM|nr:hypothetical protein ALO_17056 [Acetonema longum DSM 6540]
MSGAAGRAAEGRQAAAWLGAARTDAEPAWGIVLFLS